MSTKERIEKNKNELKSLLEAYKKSVKAHAGTLPKEILDIIDNDIGLKVVDCLVILNDLHKADKLPLEEKKELSHKILKDITNILFVLGKLSLEGHIKLHAEEEPKPKIKVIPPRNKIIT